MNYEMILLVDPKVDQKAWESKLKDTLTQFGFTFGNFDWWGKKILAYPVKKFSDALYLSLELKSGKTALKALTDRLKLDETVIRNLVLKKKGKKVI